MKSIEEIKEGYAKEKGFESWHSFINQDIPTEEDIDEIARRHSQQYIDANKELSAKLEKQEKHLDILHKMLDHIQNHEVNINDNIDRLINVALHQISKL